MRTERFCALILVGVLLCGCEASTSIDFASAGYAQADQITLAIDGVDLLDDGGSEHELDSDADASFDALDYNSGDTLRLVDGADVAQGRYTGLRLRFSSEGSALYTSDGAAYPIDIGSNLTFADLDMELDEGESGSRLVIFEPRFSLQASTTTDGHYTLTPVLRVVHPDRAASITGTVDDELVRSTACRQSRTLGSSAVVYAFVGANAMPQDYQRNSGASPVAAADVKTADDGASFYYDFPYLAAGTYTLALTCNADSENPGSDDGLAFLAQSSVTVDENESETVNLVE